MTYQKNSKIISACHAVPDLCASPGRFQGRKWSNNGWWGQPHSKWGRRAVSNPELIYFHSNFIPLFPMNLMGWWTGSNPYHDLLPSPEESLTIISISSTWPSSAAWCKGEAFTSSYLHCFFCFFVQFSNTRVFPSKTSWKHIKNVSLKHTYVKLFNVVNH